MSKPDSELVEVRNGELGAGIDTFGSLKAIHGAAGAKEILALTFDSYTVAHLLEVAWEARRSFAVALEVLEAHFELL